MKGNKKISSIFDNRHVSASQERYLRTCGYAQPGVTPDSDPSVGPSPPLNDGDSETDSVIGSGFEEDLVESHPVRFVSPPQSVDTVDLEDDATDRTVPLDSGVDEDADSVALEKSGNLLFAGQPSSSLGNRGDRGKKLKVPLRDVVKAIVMNSRNIDEEDKEIGKMSCAQILMKKGFKFP